MLLADSSELPRESIPTLEVSVVMYPVRDMEDGYDVSSTEEIVLRMRTSWIRYQQGCNLISLCRQEN